jgi:hypothetical protein
MSRKRRSAQRREGLGISLGKMEQPTGTDTVSTVDEVKVANTSRKLSLYSLADDTAVAVSQ